MTEIVRAAFSDPLVVLYVAIAAGCWFGRLRVHGFEPGVTGVLLVSLPLGYAGFTLPPHLGKLGLSLFLYAIGIQIGQVFFAKLREEGRASLWISLAITLSTAAATVGVLRLLPFDAALGAGLFTGVFTSASGLAVAMERFGPRAAIAHGIAFPVSVVTVALFFQFLPRLLRSDLPSLSKRLDQTENGEPEIASAKYVVANGSLIGRTLAELRLPDRHDVVITRIRRGGDIFVPDAATRLSEGDIVMATGPVDALEHLAIGPRSTEDLEAHTDIESREYEIVRGMLMGRRLRDLDALRRHAVVLVKVRRGDHELTPSPAFVFESGDVVTLVGVRDRLAAFVSASDLKPRIEEVDVFSLFLGLLAGLLVGNLEFALFGSAPVTLGTAGGTLLAGLAIGWFRTLGPLSGRIPQQTRKFLKDLGMILFLADAGVHAGQGLVETSGRDAGLLFLAAFALTLVPLAAGYLVTRWFYRRDMLTALGLLAGGVNSTPALGILVANAGSDAVARLYASVYPVTIFLVILLSRLAPFWLALP